MKRSTKDHIEGTLDRAKGTVEKHAGKLTNDPELEAKGVHDERVGKVEQVVAKVEKSLLQ